MFYDINGPPAMAEAVAGPCFTMQAADPLRRMRWPARVLRHKRPTRYGGGGGRPVFYDVNGPPATAEAVAGPCFTI